MKLLADENIESEIVTALRSVGFEVADIKDIDPGINDDDVLRRAKTSNAVLLTYDKDFGELVFRERLATNGVIFLRLPNTPRSEKIRRVVEVLSDHEVDLVGSFTVVSVRGLRIRKG